MFHFLFSKAATGIIFLELADRLGRGKTLFVCHSGENGEDFDVTKIFVRLSLQIERNSSEAIVMAVERDHVAAGRLRRFAVSG